MTRATRGAAYRFGLHAEGLCAWRLRLKGYRILARRFRVGAGEIDIVARRGRVVAFVEVKARREAGGEEALTPRQRARIVRAAEAFLARRPELAGLDLRFDVMLVRPWGPPRHLCDAWRP
ncbi:MAG: YraN family protein [Alphaproteobacteria bacterium]